MRELYLLITVNDIVFEYQPSEFRLSNKIRKSCETEEKTNNSGVAE